MAVTSSDTFNDAEESKRRRERRQAMSTPAQPAADEATPRVWIVSVVMVQNGLTKVNVQNKLYEITASEAAEARGKARELAASDFPQHYVHTVCQIEVTRAQSAAVEGLVDTGKRLVAEIGHLQNITLRREFDSFRAALAAVEASNRNAEQGER